MSLYPIRFPCNFRTVEEEFANISSPRGLDISRIDYHSLPQLDSSDFQLGGSGHLDWKVRTREYPLADILNTHRLLLELKIEWL